MMSNDATWCRREFDCIIVKSLLWFLGGEADHAFTVTHLKDICTWRHGWVCTLRHPGTHTTVNKIIASHFCIKIIYVICHVQLSQYTLFTEFSSRNVCDYTDVSI